MAKERGDLDQGERGPYDEGGFGGHAGGEDPRRMQETRQRTPAAVLEDHLRQSREGTLNRDLARNYAEDVVLLTGRGVFHGHGGVSELNGVLQEELPEARYEFVNTLVEGEFAFLEWTARSERAVVKDGVDSYVIREGKIVAQTIHYTVELQRAAGSL